MNNSWSYEWETYDHIRPDKIDKLVNLKSWVPNDTDEVEYPRSSGVCSIKIVKVVNQGANQIDVRG